MEHLSTRRINLIIEQVGHVNKSGTVMSRVLETGVLALGPDSGRPARTSHVAIHSIVCQHWIQLPFGGTSKLSWRR